MWLRDIFQAMCDYPWCAFFLFWFVILCCSALGEGFKRERVIRNLAGSIKFELARLFIIFYVYKLNR